MVDGGEQGASEEHVSRRLVMIFPGFEPLRPEAYLARFRKAAERSAAVFAGSVSFETSPLPSDGRDHPPFSRTTADLESEFVSETGFVTRSHIVFCLWNDIIDAYAARPAIVRAAAGFGALLAFIANGTFLRYATTSWRYGTFFLFPLAASGAILVLSIIAAAIPALLLSGLQAAVAAVATAVIVAIAAFHLANRRWHLMTALDDWSLARRLCEGTDPRIERRIEDFADAIALRLGQAGVDEIVVAAHSLGASFMIPALANAFENGFAPKSRFHILTVGSSLMKTALHPAASHQRSAVRRITVDHLVPWTDCQALTDPINFYKSNPATSLGIAADPPPLVVKLRLRHMVSETTYRRIKRDFFRLHRQFVLAVERRCAYSFHILLLGPGTMDDYRRHRTVDRAPLVRAVDGDIGQTAGSTGNGR